MNRVRVLGRYVLPLSVVVFSLSCASCQPDERCRAWGGSPGTSAFFQCGDQKERTVRCDAKASEITKKTKCKCALDGIVCKTFETAQVAELDTRDGAIALANANCGWQLSK